MGETFLVKVNFHTSKIEKKVSESLSLLKFIFYTYKKNSDIFSKKIFKVIIKTVYIGNNIITQIYLFTCLFLTHLEARRSYC